jgi:hypothetical protein
MLSIGLWRWCINISITILDIIHRPIFYLKLEASETGFSGPETVCPFGTTDLVPAQDRQNSVSET